MQKRVLTLALDGSQSLNQSTALQPKAKKRQLGVLDSRFKIPADFNAPLPDNELATFE